MDRRGAHQSIRTGLLLGSLAILAFGLSFVFSVLYLA
jgi:hypothetical protein